MPFSLVFLMFAILFRTALDGLAPKLAAVVPLPRRTASPWSPS